MGFSHKNDAYAFIIAVLIVISVFSAYLLKESGISGYAILNLTGISDDLVLNLTFDDPADPWKDYSDLDHEFNAVGEVNWVNQTYSKYYGGLNLSPGSDNYLNSTSLFSLSSGGYTSCMWIYYRVAPSTQGDSAGHWQVGTTSDAIGVFEDKNAYGLKALTYNTTGSYVENILNDQSTSGKWYHFCIIHNLTAVKFYVDGSLRTTRDYTGNDFAMSFNKQLVIGKGRYSSAPNGIIDEVVLWNRTNFTNSDILAIYNDKRLGTPPDLDIYVKNITYELPYDWDSDNNSVEVNAGNNMNVNITIANSGTDYTGNFNWNCTIYNTITGTETKLCSGRTALNANTETTIACNWTSQVGFFRGNCTIDSSSEISEDDETNNVQTVWIPFMDRPWFHFNLTEWYDILYPYMTDSTNKLSYETWDWTDNNGCSAFNQGYDGGNIDPYGKYARTCAVSCLINNYTGYGCSQARTHLFGWANRTVSGYNNVQEIHELAHLGVAYDILFPNLSESDNDLISRELHDICQQITNLQNTRPDLDNDDAITGDNGQGFGSGMSGFCYSLLGAYKDNPTMIHINDQIYDGSNVVDEWMDRELRLIRAYKNDSYTHYQEGRNYLFYAMYHYVENAYFENRYGLNDLTNYNHVFCSLAREMLTDTLDFNYNGDSLRNDEDRTMRGIQRGDSNSYQHPADGSMQGYAVLTYMGLLCDDINIKKSILWLRNYSYARGDGHLETLDSYLFGQLETQAGSIPNSVESVFSEKFLFDNADDILTIRLNYSYINDTVIQIDGGEERGSGHSQAQGYYLYYNGEPFLDYEQVPFEDDVRAETWKNGISLQNDTQTVEGQTSFYNANCGVAELNQHYGMSDCPTRYYSIDYPDYRKNPVEYTGDLYNYIGTSDANFAGVHVFRPYYNSNGVNEFFVKFGDVLAKRTVVSAVTEGKGIYHNFININDEYTESRNGLNFTFTRTGTNKNLITQLIHSSQNNIILGGGNTTIQYCFTKTSCSGSSRGLGTYRRMYYFTDSADLDLIHAHHWYTTGNYNEIRSINQTDKGLQQSNNFILFDTDNNGEVSYSDKNASGWALAFNENTKEIAAFNTSFIKTDGFTLFRSNDTLSVHIQRNADQITLTANSFKDIDNDGYDYPVEIEVTIDAQELTNNSDLTVRKNMNLISGSESGSEVTFTVFTDQNSDVYTITGGSSIPDNTAPGIISLTNSSVSDSSFVVTLQLNESGNATVHVSKFPDFSGVMRFLSLSYQTLHPILASGLENNTLYYWKVNGSDSRGNWYNSPAYSVTTTNISSDYPDAAKFDGRTTDFYSVGDINSISNLILEISQYGMIVFSGSVNASGADLDTYVNISFAGISLDSNHLHNLNTSATLYMYNLSFTNPRILRNGEVCSSAVCTNLNYSSGNLSFDVTYFSAYTAEETPSSSLDEDEDDSSPASSSASSSGGFIGSTDDTTANETPAESIETTEPLLESPKSNVSEGSISVLKPTELQKPAEIGKKGIINNYFIAVLIIIVFIIIAIVFYFYSGKKPGQTTSKKTHTPKKEPKKILHKKAATPLLLPDNKSIDNIFDFAKAVYAMTEKEFISLTKTANVNEWVTKALHHPEIAGVLNYAESKTEFYTMIYNIYLKEYYPDQKPYLRLNENILKFHLSSPGRIPLYINDMQIHSIEQLYKFLPMISDERISGYLTMHKHVIADWAAQFGYDVSSLLRSASTKQELIKAIKTIKAEQEMYRIFK
ncbi:hypothetical protein JXB41_03480 [Candidatus Woesearchaeota archaeon]|nr:hypothetical protein [Candidatus Woesearchaeota archaeon]